MGMGEMIAQSSIMPPGGHLRSHATAGLTRGMLAAVRDGPAGLRGGGVDLPALPAHFSTGTAGSSEDVPRSDDSEIGQSPVTCDVHDQRRSFATGRWSGVDEQASDQSAASPRSAIPASHEKRSGHQPARAYGTETSQEGPSSEDVNTWSDDDADLGYQVVRAQDDELCMKQPAGEELPGGDVSEGCASAEAKGVAGAGGERLGKIWLDSHTLQHVEKHYGVSAIDAGHVEEDPGMLVYSAYVYTPKHAEIICLWNPVLVPVLAFARGWWLS